MALRHSLFIVISSQLVTLAEEKASLLELWEERRILYEQCMDLQLFYRDTEQADAWMSKQEVPIILIRVTMAKGEQGIWLFIFPDWEDTHKFT